MKRALLLGLVSLSLFANTSTLSLDGLNTKMIPQDKMFGFTLGIANDLSLEDGSIAKMSGSFAYQALTNLWAEFSIGVSTVTNFPIAEVDSALFNYGLKAKFALIGPWKSTIMPYMGLQLSSISTPGSAPLSSYEQETLDSLRELKPIFGFTALRPIARGWMARVDLGSDVISAGVAATF